MDLRPIRLVPMLTATVLLSSGALLAADATLDTYGTLLAKYVTPRGVRYDAWRAVPADVKALSTVVAELSAANRKSLVPADRDALTINLYNARVLELVLTQKPKESIKEITPGVTGYGVFLKDAVTIEGKKLSLKELENRLREESKDPRIHFAINCASRSCPPIASEPYRGATLDAQLDKSTREFLASPGALVVKTEGDSGAKGKTRIECSKIFDWYAKDFDAAGGAAAFIGKYGTSDATTSIKAAGGAVKLDYQEYDWSLNTAP